MVGERLTFKLRELSLRTILRKQMGWFDDEKHGSGILVTRLSSDATLINGLAAGRAGQVLTYTIHTYIHIVIVIDG